MIKLIIDNIDNFNYELKDKDNNKYTFGFEFYDIPNKPKVGDYLFVDDEILKMEHELLSFGALDSIYGKKIDITKEKEIIILVLNSEKYYLKRLYG